MFGRWGNPVKSPLPAPSTIFTGLIAPLYQDISRPNITRLLCLEADLADILDVYIWYIDNCFDLEVAHLCPGLRLFGLKTNQFTALCTWWNRRGNIIHGRYVKLLFSLCVLNSLSWNTQNSGVSFLCFSVFSFFFFSSSSWLPCEVEDYEVALVSVVIITRVWRSAQFKLHNLPFFWLGVQNN